MLRNLLNSVGVIAASAALAMPLAAQTPTAPVVVPEAPTAAAPSAAAPTAAAPTTAAPAAADTPAAPAAGAAVPAALSELGITDATVTEGRMGMQRVQGTLPDGTAFRGALDAEGKLRMLRADEGKTLPADMAARLVPDAVRSAPIFAEFASVQGVGQGANRIMLFGSDAKGEPLRAAFSADGTLQQFGRGAMERAGKGMRDGKEKRGGDGWHGKGHGDRTGDGSRGKGDKDRQRDGDRRGDGSRGDGDGNGMTRGDGPRDGSGPAAGDGRAMGQGQPGAGMAQLDDDGVRSLLADGGYTGVGTITRNGPRTEAEAVNPEGENVTVTISPRGVVVRELAR